MNDFEPIQKLLRLKRYEQPPEGYFEDFLHEFQQRRLSQPVRVSFWKLLFGNLNELLTSFRLPTLAYAGIMLFAVGLTGFMVSGIDEAEQAVADLGSSEAFQQRVSLNLMPQQRISQTRPLLSAPNYSVAPAAARSNLPPSYVLETHPVSYEQPFSF